MPEPQAERGCFQERLLGGLGPVPLGMSEHTFIGNEAPGGPCVSGVGSGRDPRQGSPHCPSQSRREAPDPWTPGR